MGIEICPEALSVGEPVVNHESATVQSMPSAMKRVEYTVMAEVPAVPGTETDLSAPRLDMEALQSDMARE